MSISANFPNVFPSLELNFAQSQQLDPRITFSRSTTAPYYDGKTSVLAEQNLFLYSNTFNVGNWSTSSSATILQNAIAPDGTTTAWTLTAAATTNYHALVYGSQPTFSNNTYTFSCYIQAGTATYATLAPTSATANNYGSVTFNLSGAGSVTQTLQAGYITVISSTITLLGSFYRCTVTFSSSNSSWLWQGIVALSNSTTFTPNNVGLNSYTASGTETILIYGMQVEQRSSATAYNATTTSAITNYIPQLLTAPINAPRFDFNPTTGESLGLLIEQSSTNLLTYSQDFSNAVWTKTNATITTGANIAPDGTQTFNLLQETTATGLHAISETYTKAASAITYTQSVYFKAKERTYSYIQVSDGSGNGAIVYFNLSTGVISTAVAGVGTAFTGLSATISLVGNNVYRCTLTSTSNTATSFVAQFGSSTDGSTNSYTGNGYSGIYIWGAQLEALPFATSYIPTTSAQVTRAQDSALMTGTNFSSWYNSGQGTLYGEVFDSGLNPWAVAVSINDKFYFRQTVSNFYSNVLGSAGNSFTTTLPLKFAGTYSGNTTVMSANGLTAQTQSSGTAISGATTLHIGNYNGSTFYQNGHIKKLAYYPQVLNSTQLQALTGS